LTPPEAVDRTRLDVGVPREELDDGGQFSLSRAGQDVASVHITEVIDPVVQELVQAARCAQSEIAIDGARVVSVSGEAFLGVPYSGSGNVKHGARIEERGDRSISQRTVSDQKLLYLRATPPYALTNRHKVQVFTRLSFTQNDVPELLESCCILPSVRKALV